MSKTEKKKLGEQLLSIRRDKSWTQSQMARVIGISRVALCKAEYGQLASERSRSVYLIRKFLAEKAEA